MTARDLGPDEPTEPGAGGVPAGDHRLAAETKPAEERPSVADTRPAEAEPRRTPPPRRAGYDRALIRFVVITVIVTSSVIALSIIFAALYVPLFTTDQVPEELKNWGGLIIGFYFGTFVGLLKDWLSVPGEGEEP